MPHVESSNYFISFALRLRLTRCFVLRAGGFFGGKAASAVWRISS
jgi:hypothetical protein